MNLGELRTAVGGRSGLAVGNTVLDSIINEANQFLAGQEAWPWLKGQASATVEVDDVSFPLPEDCAALVAVSIDGIAHDPVAPALVTRARAGGFDRRVAAISDGALVVWPMACAGQEVSVEYVRTEPPLVAVTDAPLLPEAWHHAIVQKAIALVLDRDVKEEKRVLRHEASFDGWVRTIRRAALNQHRGPWRVNARTDGI